MKKLLHTVSLALLGVYVASAQVGVGTTTPATTFDVTGQAAVPTALDGILAPRLTAAQLSAKTYTAAQNGAMVYVTDAAVGTLQASNVNGIGLYTYDSTSNKWVKGGNPTTVSNIIDVASAGVPLITTVNGIASTPVDLPLPWKIHGLENKATRNDQDIYQMGRVSIGATTSPLTFDVTGKPDTPSVQDGIRAPRLTAAQLSAKLYGMTSLGAMVYVTDDAIGTAQASNVNGRGLYIYESTSNKWVKVGTGATATVSNAIGTANASGVPLTTTVNGTASTAVNIPMPWNLSGGTTTATTNAENIYQMGKVGIGLTAVPSEQLEVMGTNAIDAISVGNNTLGGTFRGKISAQGSAAEDRWMKFNSNWGTITNNTRAFGFFRANNEYLTILDNGRVGIGNASPANKLTVQGNARFNPNTTNDGATSGSEPVWFEFFGQVPGTAPAAAGGLKFGWYNSFTTIENLRGVSTAVGGLAFRMNDNFGTPTSFEAMRLSNQGLLSVSSPADDITFKSGIVAPKLTAAQLSAKTYGATENGAMVYVTDAAIGTAQAINVNGIGLYTYDSVSNRWIKVGTGATATVANAIGTPTATGVPLTTTVNGTASTAVNIPMPWNVTGGTTTATTNTQNIYQLGNVGIGATTAAATLDVTGQPATVTALDGIIAPRMTVAQLSAKSYTAAQNGAMVYVTNAATGTGQTSNVNGIGLYTYDSGTSKWVKGGVATTVSNAVGVADATGVPFTTTVNGIASTPISIPMPWNNAANGNTATTNFQNLYQQGNVRIGSNVAPGATLDVTGTARVSGAVTMAGTVTMSEAVTMTGAVTMSNLPPTAVQNLRNVVVNASGNLQLYSQSTGIFTAGNGAGLAPTVSTKVLWQAGGLNGTTTFDFVLPDPALNLGREFTLVCAGSTCSVNRGLTYANGSQYTSIPSGKRLSIIAVDVFGGPGWYVTAKDF
jgi:hypothetical protein